MLCQVQATSSRLGSCFARCSTEAAPRLPSLRASQGRLAGWRVDCWATILPGPRCLFRPAARCLDSPNDKDGLTNKPAWVSWQAGILAGVPEGALALLPDVAAERAVAHNATERDCPGQHGVDCQKLVVHCQHSSLPDRGAPSARGARQALGKMGRGAAKSTNQGDGQGPGTVDGQLATGWAWRRRHRSTHCSIHPCLASSWFCTVRTGTRLAAGVRVRKVVSGSTARESNRLGNTTCRSLQISWRASPRGCRSSAGGLTEQSQNGPRLTAIDNVIHAPAEWSLAFLLALGSQAGELGSTFAGETRTGSASELTRASSYRANTEAAHKAAAPCVVHALL